ncbi:MAG: PGF-pre-PGF domain-containing protein [Methanoregula sp.]|nr:PGF-pre-PGF domain-containing protein [Methanoregula sp.]
MFIILVVAVASGIGGPACAGTDGNNSVTTPADQGTHTIMHFTKDQLDERQNAINSAPTFSAPQQPLLARSTSSSTDSVSLLAYLPYIPSQRDQGNCGNCWVWASTGALEVEHNVNNGIRDRLSIQYLNSKYQYNTGSYACLGGDMEKFTTWYNTDKSPIPWTNTNASFGDYHPKAGGATAVPFSSITTSPSYSLNSLTNTTVSTFGVGNSSAIANIKAALDSGHSVVYLYYLPLAGWNDFSEFWSSGANTSMFDTSFYNGQEIGGGHAVLITGYDTTDPVNPYWLVVNSWGTTTNRTDGTYRLNMSMNYDAVAYESGESYQQNQFQILTSEFTGTPAMPTVSNISPGSGPVAGGTSVTITGIGFTGATNVTFGSTAATSFTKVTAADDSQIIAIAPAGTAGTVNVTVTNPYGTSAISIADQYTYTAAQNPAINSDDSPVSLSGSGAMVATAPGVPAGETMTFVYNPTSNDGVWLQIMQVQAVVSRQVGEISLLVEPVTLGDTNQVNGYPAVAGYRQIEPVGVNPSVFSSGVISFRVISSWLAANQVTPEQLVMLRNHDGIWTQLSTTYVRQEGNYYYFTAVTPGFSYFAVAVRNATVVTAPSAIAAISAETPRPYESASATSITAVQTRVPAMAVTAHPLTIPTTIAPAPPGSSGFPVSSFIVVAIAIVLAAMGIVFVRRWWIRRQNPSLFRDF